MNGPGVMRLYDRDEEPPAATEEQDLRQELPSGAATVRAHRGGDILAVEVDPRRLQQVSPAVFTAQLMAAIQQVQERAADQRRRQRQQRLRKRG
jgi:hypothetical protein